MRNRARKNTYRRRAGRRRGKPQGKPGRTLSGPLKEPPAMAFETLFPGGEIRSIVRMTEYEKIYWFDNLYRSYKMAARCKRTKTEVIEFELNLAENLWTLHDALKYLLRRFPDKEVLAFLYQIIDSYNADTGKGLPMGNQSSQWFALYYLNQIDRIIKEKYKIKYYTRYMDDLILLHEDKEHLKACLAEIRAFAQDRLKLEFNEKTQIFPVSEGVDYLGWRFYLTDTGKVIRRLRTSNKRRFKRGLKAFQEKYRSGEMDYDAIKRSLASYNGHLKHGHTWKLKTKIYGGFVLTKAPKGEATAIPGETPENA